MKKLARALGALVALLLVVALGGYAWARSTAGSKMATRYETHHIDFPIPFPLSDAELVALKTERAAQPGVDASDPLAGVDLAQLAKERAIARGKHLVESRYPCIECHGKDFSGGTMIDDPAIGHFFGVNLTSGKGGQVTDYKPSDWDRIVRHGVKPDGSPTVMPAVDFFAMSDRELSDIVAYIQSVPPVDRLVPRPTYGPLGTVLMAAGKLPLSASLKADHQAHHERDEPPVAPSADYGKHLAQVCVGCHHANFAGGKIVGGPPDWPPSRNITPGPEGLQGWTYEDFVRALKEGKRKDGSVLREPMASMPKYAANFTEVELKAMWAYLQSVPPAPTPKE